MSRFRCGLVAQAYYHRRYYLRYRTMYYRAFFTSSSKWSPMPGRCRYSVAMVADRIGRSVGRSAAAAVAASVAIAVRTQRTILSIERDDAASRSPGAVSIVVFTVVVRTSVFYRTRAAAADG